MTDLQSLFEKFEAAANDVLLERETEVSCVRNALLTRSHVFFLGAPGVAKTFLSRVVVGLIDGLGPEDYFDWEMGRFSDPAEILGPHDPRELKQGRFVRNTSHKLPRARIGHIGEIWKTSSATANYLLSLTNERLFYNGGADGPERAPLCTLLCDSNETPEHTADLAALWDRMTFRVPTRPVQGRGNRERMLRAAAGRFAATGSASEPVVTPVLAWSDIEAAQEEVRRVVVGDVVYEALIDLVEELGKAGVVPSERRQVSCLWVLMAEAWRARRSEAVVADMAALTHVLWSRREEIPKVQRLVFSVASPWDSEAMDLSDRVETLAVQVERLVRDAGTASRRRDALDTHERLAAEAQRLVDLKDQAEAAGQALQLLTPLSNRILALTRSIYPLV